MKYKIMDNSLVICSNAIKKDILMDLCKNNGLLNIKFMTIDEFKKEYFGTYDSDALYFLLKHYNINYDVAMEYLDNLFYGYEKLKDIYNDLKANDLLIFNELFKKELKGKNILVIGYDGLDKCIKDELLKLKAEFRCEMVGSCQHDAYEFLTISDEVNFVANDIIKRNINGCLNDFYLINVNEEYNSVIRRIFKMYNLPVNFNGGRDIYGTEIVQKFLKRLYESRNIEDALGGIEKGEVYNAIIDILNKYTIHSDIDEAFIQIIENELRNKRLKDIKYDNAVGIINYLDVVDLDKFYYYMNFNEGSVPSKIYDDALIKDKDRVKLGLNTSFDILSIEKNRIKMVINNYPNLIITYKLKDYFNSYLVSPLLADLNVSINKINEGYYNYSNKYNKLKLAEKLDDYYRFNLNDKELIDLVATYPNIQYKEYCNEFTGIDTNTLKGFLNNKINISYSSMDNYFHCAFRYYINNILKLDPFNDTFMIFIGNLYHFCLSNMYQDNFDLKTLYDEYLKKRDLTNKEKFFVNKLYNDLEKTIEVIRNQDSHSKFKSVMCEKHIAIDKSHDMAVNFIGFVDKIKYEEKDGVMWIVIVDYKTGSPKTTLDNINYGLHLQLPVYIYLTKKGLHRNVKIAGFYLQKILNPRTFDSDKPDEDVLKKLKLDGYTIDDFNIINDLDDTSDNSLMIKGLGKNVKGEYKSSAKLLSEDEINQIIDIVDENIDDVVRRVDEGDFKINPKRIDEKLVGCENCHYQDICFKKEEDIVDLENKSINDILGGDENE